jgi:hypothetical protein
VSTIFRVFLDWLDIIEGSLKISKPMTELLKNDKKVMVIPCLRDPESSKEFKIRI